MAADFQLDPTLDEKNTEVDEPTSVSPEPDGKDADDLNQATLSGDGSELDDNAIAQAQSTMGNDAVAGMVGPDTSGGGDAAGPTPVDGTHDVPAVTTAPQPVDGTPTGAPGVPTTTTAPGPAPADGPAPGQPAPPPDPTLLATPDPQGAGEVNAVTQDVNTAPAAGVTATPAPKGGGKTTPPPAGPAPAPTTAAPPSGGTAPAPAPTVTPPAPAAPPPAPAAPVKAPVSMKGWLASHPDTAAAERVGVLGNITSKVGRDQRKLRANLPKPIDNGLLNLVDPRKSWESFTKTLASNPYKGEDGVLSFLTQLNATIDFIKDVSGKVGLVATVGGAILALIFPPVGAFLLTVGRICNGVTLACAGIRMVTGIIKQVMLAVKIAKETDPIKRMEMMQDMQSEAQAVALSGLDVLLSKLGGKGKTQASKVKAGGLKNAKGTLGRSASEGVKGARNALGRAGTAIKGKVDDVIAGAKGAIAREGGGLTGALKAGYKGTRNAIGDGIHYAKSIPGRLKHQVTTKIPQQLKANLRKSWNKNKALVTNGPYNHAYAQFSKQRFTLSGKIGAHFKALGATTYKNTVRAYKGAGPGFMAKAKALGGGLGDDLFNASKGGYAAQLQSGMTGKSMNAIRTEYRSAKNTLDFAQNGTREQKIQVLQGGTLRRGKIVAPPGGFKGHYGHLDNDTLGVLISQKVKVNADSVNLLNWKKGLTKAGVNQLRNPDLDTSLNTAAKDVMGGTGPMTGWAGDAMGLHDVKGGPSSIVDGGAEGKALSTRQDAAMASYIAGFQKESTSGVVAAEVQSALAPIAGLLQQRALEFQSQAPAPAAGAAGPGPSIPSMPQVEAPPEDLVVPGEDVLASIASEKAKIPGFEAEIDADIATAKKAKVQAEAALKKAQGAKASGGKMAAAVGDNKKKALDEAAKLKQSAAQQAAGAQGMAGQRGAATAQQGTAAAAKAKGGGLTGNVKADEAGKRKKEREKARRDKANYDYRYSKASRWQKFKMKVSAAWSSFTGFLKRAANWVWKKLIAPAIRAVKKALSKVLGFINDMIMKGVMAIVKQFLSKEEAGRLDKTFTDMKTQQNAESQKAVMDAEKTASDVSTKGSEVEQKAGAEIARCQANITQGEALKKTLAENKTALTAEETKANGARAEFTSKYGLYFEQQAKGAQGGPAGGAGGAGAGPPQPDQAQNPNRALDPGVAAALGSACDKVDEGSRTAETKVETDCASYAGRVGKKADSFTRFKPLLGNGATDTYSSAGAGGSTQEHERETQGYATYGLDAEGDAETSAAPTEEPDTRKIIETKEAANKIAKDAIEAHSKLQTERRGRLAGLRSLAGSIKTKDASDAFAIVHEIQTALGKEAAGVETERDGTIDACLKEMMTCGKSRS